MSSLIFYTTEGCHLCEEAALLLETLNKFRCIEIETVDISCDEGLVNLYGIRIPVVRNKYSGNEIGWPFGLAELAKIA